MKNSSESSSASLGASISLASELGGSFAITVLLGWLVGNWLDGLLKCAPWGVMTGLMLGMGLGMAIVVKRADKLEKRSSRAKAELSSQSDGEPPADCQ